MIETQPWLRVHSLKESRLILQTSCHWGNCSFSSTYNFLSLLWSCSLTVWLSQAPFTSGRALFKIRPPCCWKPEKGQTVRSRQCSLPFICPDTHIEGMPRWQRNQFSVPKSAGNGFFLSCWIIWKWFWKCNAKRVVFFSPSHENTHCFPEPD